MSDSKESAPHSIHINRNRFNRFQPGDNLVTDITQIQPDGTPTTYTQHFKLASVAGGGFYGRVLIPESHPFVIKTTQPDAFHDLIRRLNWRFHKFTPQHTQVGAEHDYLATKLIHLVLPSLTDGQFYAPDAQGFTKLSTGYGQKIEQMKGRGPRFDTNRDEVGILKQGQQTLTKWGFELGLEQVGQIHPDNPFAFPNLWLDNDVPNRIIWLDTQAAMPHKKAFGVVPFSFYEEIKDRLLEPDKFPDTTTFNRIHTDMFWKTINKTENFTKKQLADIRGYLDYYEQVRKQYDAIHPKLDLPGTIEAASVASQELSAKAPRKAGSAVISPWRFLFSRDYQNELLSAGTEKAYGQGMMTDEEYLDSTLKLLGEDRSLTFKALYGYYLATSIGSKTLEGTAYYSILQEFDGSEDILTSSLIAVAGRVLPNLAQFLGTRLLGKLTNQDMRTAAIVSVMPFAGNHLAPQIQLSLNSGKNDNDINRHYALRKAIADATSILPQGGWGSEIEAQTYKKITKWLDRKPNS